MTAGFLVVLENDLQAESAAAVAAALGLVRGVVAVEAVPASPDQGVGWARCDRYWRERLAELLARDPSTAGDRR